MSRLDSVEFARTQGSWESASDSNGGRLFLLIIKVNGQVYNVHADV
jgi:hypothetical protein